MIVLARSDQILRKILSTQSAQLLHKNPSLSHNLLSSLSISRYISLSFRFALCCLLEKRNLRSETILFLLFMITRSGLQSWIGWSVLMLIPEELMFLTPRQILACVHAINLYGQKAVTCTVLDSLPPTNHAYSCILFKSTYYSTYYSQLIIFA